MACSCSIEPARRSQPAGRARLARTAAQWRHPAALLALLLLLLALLAPAASAGARERAANASSGGAGAHSGPAAAALAMAMPMQLPPPPPPPEPVRLPTARDEEIHGLGAFAFNPSLVRHRGVYVATARETVVSRDGPTAWWLNEARICMGADPTFKGGASSCRAFDPWRGRYRECRWGAPGGKAAAVDTRGLEDAKLFAWPGRGVYAIFGRKPEQARGGASGGGGGASGGDRGGGGGGDGDSASQYCPSPVVFVQFLVQVVTEEGRPRDRWTAVRPRELRAGPFAAELYGGDGGAHSAGATEAAAAKAAGAAGAAAGGAATKAVKEKNWMPFVYDDRLFAVHSVSPQAHRVFELGADGVAVRQYVTRSAELAARLPGEDLHGGPPLVLVGGAKDSGSKDSSGSGGKASSGSSGKSGAALLAPGAAPHYLGALHYFRTVGAGASKVKVYRHHLYKMEAAPPFRVCAVSAELPLVTRLDLARPSAGAGGHHSNSSSSHDGSKDGSGAQPPPRRQRVFEWKDTSRTAYVAGLFVDGDELLVSYGSSDAAARVLALRRADLEALFAASPFDCGRSEVVVSGGGGGGASKEERAGGQKQQQQKAPAPARLQPESPLLQQLRRRGGSAAHKIHHRLRDRALKRRR